MLKLNFNLKYIKRFIFQVNDSTFNLGSDHVQLRKLVYEFAQKELTPLANEIDIKNNFSAFRPFFKKLGSLGLLGITAPSEYGGTDLGYLANCIVMEELSRVSGSIGLSYGVQSNLTINQIVRNGNEKQKLKYLPKLISGEYIGALAMSESGSGSDVFAMKTLAIKQDNGYLLNGSKFWITNGPDADIFIVYAKTPPHSSNQSGPNHKHISAFLIDKGTPGFKTGPKLDKLGMRGSNTCELIFEDCFIPKENLMGKENDGARILMSGLDFERLVLAAGPIGIMQACCDVAFDYCHERKAFGQPIGTYQLMQSKMANMYVDLLTSRSLVYTIALACDKGNYIPMDCTAAIYYTSKAATKTALEAIQCLGGNGYINDYPTGRFLRDAKLYEIGAGTNEIRELVIGRAINTMYGVKCK